MRSARWWPGWWPGQTDRGIPPGVPGEAGGHSHDQRGRGLGSSSSGDGEISQPPRRSWLRVAWAATAGVSLTVARTMGAVLATPLRWVADSWPGQNHEPAVPSDERRRRFRLPGVGKARSVIAAVYASLADPLVGGDSAARERRAAMVRRTSRVALSLALAALLIYAIFPVRTYLNLRTSTDRAETRLEVLTEENKRLDELRERLQEDDEVERIARRDYGLIYPGEDSYGILPAPGSPTTTTGD